LTYEGIDRRVHKVYVTANTEYHFRRGLCVGVFDRRREKWFERHRALDKSISCVLKLCDNGMIAVDKRNPEVGDSLCVGEDLITSPIQQIARPPREVVAHYRL
jgi:hypothetical protein